MERLMTVKDVMEVIPLGKTSCVDIIKGLPHINRGKKLLIEPRYIRQWIASNTKDCSKKALPAPAKPRRRKVEGLTEDGLIPYRKKGA